MSDPNVSIQNLRVDYGDVTAVKNLSLEIGKGEIYGLVGPNGAGKTSTLNVLATLLIPTYGEVHVAGYSLDTDPREIRRRLGYMPDLAPVIGDLKVREFLELFAGCYGLTGRRRKERIDECLERVGMTDHRRTFCGTLSRGMSQRVILAKTLLHEPKVLLLDEPASGMDPIARMELKETLKLVAAGGATVLLSSHILSELAELATSVGILHKGELRHHGAVADVLSSKDQGHHRLVVELLEPEQSRNCRQWIHSRHPDAEVREKRNQPGLLELEMPGSRAEHADFLRALIEAGYRVTGFTMEQSRLEDLLRNLDEPTN